MKFSIDIDRASMNKIDAALSAIETNLRGSAAAKGLRAIGQNIAQKTKATLPKAGYTRYTRTKHQKYTDKDGYKPLGDTVKTDVASFAGGVVKVALIGYAWPAGNHGHLVELGHDMVVGGKKKSGGRVVGHVEPAGCLITIVESSRPHFDSIMIEAIKKLVK